MIKEIREQAPFINFGFNRTLIETHIGLPIIIWQDSIYKNNQDFIITSSGVVVESISSNKIVISYTTTGTKSLLITTPDGIKSNSINIKVNPITWDSKDIFFNNENVTFNSI